MFFDSIVINNVEFGISGEMKSITNEELYVEFDITDEIKDTILEAFFKSQPISFLNRETDYIDSIILKNKGEFYFLYQPGMKSHSINSNGWNYELVHLSIVSASYIIKDSRTPIAEMMINEYKSTSFVHRSFGLLFPRQNNSNDIVFKYKEFEVKIRFYFDESDFEYRIDILLKCSSEKAFDEFDLTYLYLVELITLFCGHSPRLIERELKERNNSVLFLRKMVDKHITLSKEKQCLPVAILNAPNIFTQTLIDEYISKKERLGLIPDILLYNLNTDIYQDIKSNTYVHLVEGYMKSKGCTGDLYNLIRHFFDRPDILNILDRKDTEIIPPSNQEWLFSKSKNHRNYLSHLNRRDKDKKMFSLAECVYANIKFSTALRASILKDLDLPIDSICIENIKKQANYQLDILQSSPD